MRLTLSGSPADIGDALRSLSGLDATDDGCERDRWFREACRLLRDEGRKIAAIKCWRGAYGTGLREAKEAVEGL